MCVNTSQHLVLKWYLNSYLLNIFVISLAVLPVALSIYSPIYLFPQSGSVVEWLGRWTCDQ